jgi:hypothetical protein
MLMYSFIYFIDETGEIQQMLSQWKKETPSGVIYKKEFKDFLTAMGMYGYNSLFVS